MSKSELSRIEAIVQQKVAHSFGSCDKPHFIIGVSGGMDSMSLLYAFYQLNISACVVHLNYQKRGKEADKDADLVARIAEQWDFNYKVVDVDPDEAEGENFQQWARDRRYQLFEKLAEEQQADGIAIAHHRDDQIETILQKMFRGGGLASWSAMQVWDGRLFRPLLDVSRDDIAAYVQENDIPYRTDSSNLQSDFARNFLRNEWLTRLSDFFPGWQQNVLRISEQARHFEQAIGWIADDITDDRGINRSAFHTLEAGLQKAVILYLLKKKNPDINISRNSLDQLENLQHLQTGKEVQFSEQFSLMRDRQYYCIIGDQQTPFSPIVLSREKLEQSAYTMAGLSFEITSGTFSTDDTTLCLDVEKISWPLTLRRWQEGDRFQPLGMEGHQTVSDHLTNRKINAAQKEKALVVESFEETICAVIFPPIKKRTPIGTISEQTKCSTGTKRCLKITYNR